MEYSNTAQEDSSISSAAVSLYPVQNGFLAASQISSSRTGPLCAENRWQLNENVAISVAGCLEIELLRFIEMEWKDVEERFNRLAKTGSSPLPAMNALDFSLCIGMQQSPEFAKELLGALRGRKNGGADITKNELHDYWHRITNPCFNSRLQLFFDLCDENMDGRITRREIKQVILLSASTNKLFVTREEAEEYANLIVEALDTEDQGYIELSQLETLFKVSSSRGYFLTDQVVTSPTSDHDDRYQETTSTAEILFRTHWRRAWIVLCWLIVCFALFAWKFNQYSHRTAFEVMGYCLCTAKGAAETLKFNMALILLPVCRNSTTWLRKHCPINSVIPFNDNINFHKTWMYIAIPVLLYASERMFRAMRSDFSYVKILKATIYPGKVLSLKMYRPEGFKYKSGMYIYIQCPQISSFEWHPFSLTSGPEDDHLSVHIRALGDWSYQIYSLFQEAIVSAGTVEHPKMYIDGPYGAASQDHVKYDILVLIGLGIGVTPFISVLKDVNCLQKPNHDHRNCRTSSITNAPSKAYLYWVTREAGSFEWFKDIMKEISKTNQKQDVVEMHNFLTCVYQAGDARSALISAIQALHHAKYGTDIVSHTPVLTHFGRPNWFRIFSNLARRHRETRIGVFYCGPSKLARDLESLCTKFSTKTTTRFVFHKENY
ncbi:hypothetical protein F0562_024998 [Nyssa sinensis]|uniref:FAD-binding FR-type domain-containing protein n=1 Tax=Nyssa sinensis TaxID=561372 RepID=A0A5J5BCX6_9ASTE|nr:hypothetical protein F0562_024998 [Nyssa sinensis]